LFADWVVLVETAGGVALETIM